MTPRELSDLPAGYSLRVFGVVDSTNAQCRRIAAAGTTGNVWVQADEQTAGRGRRGREWTSKPGNLFASLLYGVNCDLPTAAGLSFVAALAVRDAVADSLPTDARVMCKWPNDILVGGRKIAGILLETTGQGACPPSHVIIGIGINVIDHPEQAHYPATDMKKEAGDNVEMQQVMTRLVASMAHWILRWQQAGFRPIRKAWKHNAHGLGQDVIVRLSEEELRGRFIDLDKTGALVLEFDGKRRHITAGDVFFA